jgi:hypothetical protein
MFARDVRQHLVPGSRLLVSRNLIEDLIAETALGRQRQGVATKMGEDVRLPLADVGEGGFFAVQHGKYTV